MCITRAQNANVTPTATARGFPVDILLRDAEGGGRCTRVDGSTWEQKRCDIRDLVQDTQR
jgi:hypothetical protein